MMIGIWQNLLHHFIYFAAETTCNLGSSAIQFVKGFVKELHGDSLHVVQLIQQILVALHLISHQRNAGTFN